MNNYGYYPSYNYAYQPQSYQQPQAQMNLQPTQDDRIWVASEAAAEAYPIQAGSFLRLWDSNSPYYYEKRADASGRPLPIVTYEYKIKGPGTVSVSEPEPKDYEERIAAIESKIAKLEKAAKKPTKTKEEPEDE